MSPDAIKVRLKGMVLIQWTGLLGRMTMLNFEFLILNAGKAERLGSQAARRLGSQKAGRLGNGADWQPESWAVGQRGG